MTLFDTHVPLLASAAWSMAREAPLQFATQVSRRYIPHAARRALASGAQCLPFESSPRMLAAALADRPDLAPPRPETSAMDLWNLGDASAALAVLPANHPVSRKIADEFAVLSGTERLSLHYSPPPPSAQPGNEITHPDHTDVLHFLSNSFPYTQSGYTVRTQRLLSAQRESGLSVAAATRIGYPVITGSFRVPEVNVIDGIPYHHLLPNRLPRLLSERLRAQAVLLQSLATRLTPAVLHTTTEYRNALTVGALARSLDIPWVYEMRGQLEDSWVARHPAEVHDRVRASERYRAWRALETRMAKEADAVVVLSHIQEQGLIERGISPEKIWVLPNAFDWPTHVPRLDRSQARSLLELPEAAVWVGSVSALVDYEGFDTLLHSIKILVDRGVDIRCAIVGDGVSRPHLEALAQESGIADRVIFPGRVPIADSHTWYQALDIFAIPRKDTEVTRSVAPLKPLEALACGIPVVISSLPALEEIVGSGVGAQVPADEPEAWAEALGGLMPGSSAYADASTRALARSQELSWKTHAQTTRQMYRQIGADIPDAG